MRRGGERVQGPLDGAVEVRPDSFTRAAVKPADPTARTLLLVGTSHHRVDLALRERLHLSADDAAALAKRLALDGEAVVLSTCNRTELYLAAGDRDRAAARARAELAAVSGLGDVELAPLLYESEDEDAALHLFRVAAGLDSLLPGEVQILGQVRRAYEGARAAGATGPVLSRLFAEALHAGKRARSETGVGVLPASIPAAAAEAAERALGDLAGRRVLVLGAGKIAALAVADFVSRGVEQVFVSNHRLAGAEELARRLGGEAVPFERVPAELERADVVLAATRCPRIVLGAADVEPVLGRRRGRPILFLDIAVPRDIDPRIGELEGCSLYDLDELAEALGEDIAARREELAGAEAIVAEEAARFREWQLALEVSPVVTALRRRAEEIRRAELARTGPRLQTLSPRERQAVEALTAQIVSKLLHEPTVRMKEAAARSGGPTYADALRDLFALDEGHA